MTILEIDNDNEYALSVTVASSIGRSWNYYALNDPPVASKIRP